MQTLFLTGNLAADCEIVPGKEGKGRYVALVGNLRVWENIKDGKTYVNHDVWVQTLDVPALVGGE